MKKEKPSGRRGRRQYHEYAKTNPNDPSPYKKSKPKPPVKKNQNK